MTAVAEEDFQARCDRITREWTTLAKRMRAWCNAAGHSMGPLHPMHSTQRLADPRRSRCRHCHFYVWVRLDASVQGLPTYQECKARAAIRRRYEG